MAPVLTKQQRVKYKRKKIAKEQVPTFEKVYAMVDAADQVKGWRSPLKKARAKALILCAF